MKLGWLIVLIYLILAYKNPFSNRSLVPNLEPYPDSLYYSYPAWSWLHRNGFGMNYGADSIPTIVPPGYGWWLTPFFAIFDDVRGFYVANLVLQVGTIIFFLATIKNLIGRNKISPLIMGLGGMVLVTNFYFYNLPGLLMAENPTVFLVAVGIYLLSGKVTKLKSILAGLMGIIFWLIKLSNIPLGLSFLLLYGVKIGQEKGRKYLGYYLGSVLLQTAVYFLIFFDKSILSNSNNVNSPPAFSLNYFRNNFNFYLRSLLGGETNYLWYRQKFISPLLGILSVVGGITAIFQKKYRLSGIYYLVILGSLVGFMSLFITPDARYIFSLLPILIILALITLAVIAGAAR